MSLKLQLCAAEEENKTQTSTKNITWHFSIALRSALHIMSSFCNVLSVYCEFCSTDQRPVTAIHFIQLQCASVYTVIKFPVNRLNTNNKGIVNFTGLKLCHIPFLSLLHQYALNITHVIKLLHHTAMTSPSIFKQSM